MNKAINIENSNKTVVRVLSITDESAAEYSPNGLSYFVIDNYVDPPEVSDPALQLNYPMYNKETGEFKWITVDYQNTAAAELIEIENLRHTVSELEAQNVELQEVVDTLLAENLLASVETEEEVVEETTTEA